MSTETGSSDPDQREIEEAVEALRRGEKSDLPTESHPNAHDEKLLDRRSSKGSGGDDTLEWITSLLQ